MSIFHRSANTDRLNVDKDDQLLKHGLLRPFNNNLQPIMRYFVYIRTSLLMEPYTRKNHSCGW